MLLNLKALVVVLFAAFVVFALAKPLWLRFTEEADFERRRNVWLVLTVTAFVTPSFWAYALVAVPTILWAAKRDSTPLALYVMLMFVIPPMEVRIPTIGIDNLFEMSNIRLLNLLLLLPVAVRSISAKRGALRLTSVDVLVLLFGALQMVLLMPYESLTNTMRRSFLFLLDVYIVYFAFSRLLDDRRQIGDALAALCLVAAISAPIAAFEWFRSWLLYIGIGEIWAHVNRDAYLMRGDSLRAQAAMGHSITLGYLLATALGFWLYLRQLQTDKARDLAFLAGMGAGLLFTFARGPWVMAAVVVAAFPFIGGRKVLGNAFKVLFWLAVGMGVVALTPFGANVIDSLPFIGTQGQDSVTYRQQLAEVSWTLIQQNPFFGNPFVMLQMEELRPGEGGIIDLVNGYAQVALFYGLVGLAFFAAFFAASMLKAYQALRLASADDDADMVALGSALLACMLGTLVFIATAGAAYLQWLLAGLLVSYAGVYVQERRVAYEWSRGNSTRRPRGGLAT